MKIPIEKRSENECFEENKRSSKRKLTTFESDNNIMTDNLNNKDENNLSVKKKMIFCGKTFRNNLKTSEKINSLKEFVALCKETNSTTDYVLQYLEAGGSCFEILMLLDSSDNSNLHFSRYVFETITNIVLKILSCAPQHISDAEEACKQLLAKHLSKIHTLLSSKYSKEKKVVLKLLTSIITLSSSLSKEILLSVNIEDVVLQDCIKHKSGPDVRDNVRITFIHFIVAFLIEGHAGNIRRLIEKEKILISIIPGLMYDDARTVCMVLSVFKKHVLQTTILSKTNKLYIFSTPVIKSLISLYSWKGPKGFEKNTDKVPINGEEKATVLDTVHDFLLILCTSHKYGVAFHDKSIGLNRKKHNSLLYTVLEDLENPWKNRRASDLIIKIIQACPDLMELILLKATQGLEKGEKLEIYHFLKTLFSDITFDFIDISNKELTCSQLVIIIEKLIVPKYILSLYANETFMKENEFIQSASLNLLLSMLKCLQRSIDIILSKKLLTQNESNYLKLSLNDYLNKLLPSPNIFLKIWDSVITQDLRIIILDLFIYYYKLSSRILNETIPNFTPIKILKDLTSEVETNKSVFLKASEFLLLLDPIVFSPDKEYFAEYFSVICNCPKNQSENIIHSIFSNTGIFYVANEEISIWTEAIFEYNLPIHLLIESLVLAYKNLSEYSKYIEEIKTKNVNYENANENIIDLFDLIEQENEKDLELTRQSKSIKPSPLFLTIIKLSKSTEWENFKPLVVDILYLQSDPYILLKILSESKNSILQLTSIFSFKEIEKVQFPIPIHHKNLSSELIHFSEELLNIKQNNLSAILSSIKVSVKYFQCILFYFNQFILNKLLTETYNSRFMDAFIYILDHFNSEIKFKKDLLECINLLYAHSQIHTFFLPFARKKQYTENLVTRFIVKITKYIVEKYNDLNIKELLVPFRLKLVKRFSILLKKFDKCTVTEAELIDLFRVFKLDYSEYFELIHKISEVPFEYFISKQNTLSSVPLILAHCLTYLSENYDESKVLEKEAVIKITHFYIQLINYPVTLNTEILDEAFLIFFSKFPHLIGFIHYSLFETIVKKDSVSKTLSKLASFLLSRDNTLKDILVKNFDTVLVNRDLMFSLCKEIKELSETLQCKIFEHYKTVFLKNVEKPQKMSVFFHENSSVIIDLINKYMSVDEWLQFVKKIQKYTTANKYHLDVFECICNKCIMETKNETYANNYICTLLQLLSFILNREIENPQIIIHLCVKITSFIEKNKVNKFNYEKIQSTSLWRNFMKISLKQSLQQEMFLEECNNNLLNVLTVLCEHIYPDNCENKDVLQEIALIHEMTLSHSGFLIIMLGNFKVKATLAKFLLILTKKNKEVMSTHHIPLFLGAYNGTFSDRFILTILATYETSSISLHPFRPYVWGEFAINHYSVRENVETALWRQPSTAQVLDLLNGDIVLNNIYDLVVNTSLDPTVICNDKYSENIENNYINHFVTDKLKQSKMLKTTRDTKTLKYDPSFYLPLFSHLLAPDSVVQYYKFSQSGALSLTLSFLSSNDENVRFAAAHVISRYHFHLEGDKSGSNEKKIWLRLIDAIRRGAVIYKKRLPCVWVVFLARASIVLTQPTHSLYSSLSHFLLAKESFDFSVVPDLLHLFHSSEIDFKQHRHWILEIIRDGMKTTLDNEIMLRSVAYKFILDFYSSVLADENDKLLTLQIIRAAMCIKEAKKILIFGFGLISWLHDVIDNIKNHKNESLSLIIHILVNVWETLVPLSESKTVSVKDIKNAKLIVIHLIIKLSNVLSININSVSYMNYVKLIYDIISEYAFNISKEQLMCIVKHGTKVIGNNDCEYMLKYGCQYVDEPLIPILSTGDMSAISLTYLRLLTIKWIREHDKKL